MSKMYNSRGYNMQTFKPERHSIPNGKKKQSKTKIKTSITIWGGALIGLFGVWLIPLASGFSVPLGYKLFISVILAFHVVDVDIKEE